MTDLTRDEIQRLLDDGTGTFVTSAPWTPHRISEGHGYYSGSVTGGENDEYTVAAVDLFPTAALVAAAPRLATQLLTALEDNEALTTERDELRFMLGFDPATTNNRRKASRKALLNRIRVLKRHIEKQGARIQEVKAERDALSARLSAAEAALTALTESWSDICDAEFEYQIVASNLEFDAAMAAARALLASKETPPADAPASIEGETK